MSKLQDNKIAGKERIFYFDVLRAIAMLAVVAIHVSAQGWYYFEPTTATWNIYNFWDSISRWAVPIFVMISGALFLDNTRPLEIRRLFKGHIGRLCLAFILWSGVYAAYQAVLNRLTIAQVLSWMVTGHYHLWFIPMIIGLYILTPILRKITADRQTTKYFLAVALIFSSAIPFLFSYLLPAFGLNEIPEVAAIGSHLELANLATGYATYYVLGYYLAKANLSSKKTIAIYALSAFGFAVTIFGTALTSIFLGSPRPEFLWNLSPNVFLESTGVFLLVKNIFSTKSVHRSQRAISWAADISFGVYLVHPLFIELFHDIFGITAYNLPVLVAVPVYVGVIFLASALTIHAVKKGGAI